MAVASALRYLTLPYVMSWRSPLAERAISRVFELLHVNFSFGHRRRISKRSPKQSPKGVPIAFGEDWPRLSSEKLGIQPHQLIPCASAIYGLIDRLADLSKDLDAVPAVITR